MAQITNQAAVTFQYGAVSASASSNIATATLQGPLTAQKSSLFTTYRVGDEPTYAITLTNGSSAAVTNIQVVDDLATYTITGPVSVTPLTYIGPANLYINGILSGPITPVAAADSLTFTVPSLAAGATAMILYAVQVNDYAPQAAGSLLVNNTAITATGMTGEIYASYSMQAEAFADVSIIKSMSPGTVTEGGVLNYSFALYNYGNTAATNVVLTDTFSPAPVITAITVDGAAVANTEYTYTGGLLTLPAPTAATLSITIPAATFTQDPATGLVTVSPGMVNIVVTGTV